MALKFYRRVESDIAVQQIIPRRHQNRAPIGSDTDGIIEEAPGDEGVAEEPAANDEVVATEQE